MALDQSAGKPDQLAGEQSQEVQGQPEGSEVSWPAEVQPFAVLAQPAEAHDQISGLFGEPVDNTGSV